MCVRLNLELWISWASLLRSYAAVASLNGGPAAEIAVTQDAIRIAVGDARLQMSFDPESGSGNWRVSGGPDEAKQGRFEMLPEGVIAMDGKVQDLDHAAIEFVAVVAKRSSR